MIAPDVIPGVYARVYHSQLRPVLWGGVPIKLLLYNLMGTMGAVMLMFLASLAGALSTLLACLIVGVIVLLAAAFHLFMMWATKYDPDLLEIFVRFIRYPSFLGPR